MVRYRREHSLEKVGKVSQVRAHMLSLAPESPSWPWDHGTLMLSLALLLAQGLTYFPTES